jgi:foldase protein PrsA
MRRVNTAIQPSRGRALAAIALALPLACLAPGCGGSGRADEPLAGARLAEAPERSRRAGDPPAVIDGTVVPWSALQPLLAEAAGAQILEEVALDRALAEESRRRGVTVTPEQIRAEELTLLRTLLASGAALDDAGSQQVLADLRERRGLGPARYDRLLRRTALLRALVQNSVDLSEEAVRRAYELRHGPRYRVRLITVDSAPAADAALARLSRGESFAEVAARVSTDPSASRGGLLEPISAADLSYPSALREALPRLEPDKVAGPIALERNFALVRLEETLPADDVSFEEVRDEVERDARIAQERLLMSDLANRLLAASGITPLDPSLGWSWRVRR